MKIIECDQGSQEWLEVRRGIPTASNFDKIITPDGKLSKSRMAYLYKLAAEQITGTVENMPKSEAMKNGIELEPEARKFVELVTCQNIKQVGFCLMDNLAVGCSPDGLIDDDGGCEIKCPLPHNHIKYLLDAKMPNEYYVQVQGNLLITGRKWWKFISYHPKIKPLFIDVLPDKDFQDILTSELVKFCMDLAELSKKLK